MSCADIISTGLSRAVSHKSRSGLTVGIKWCLIPLLVLYHSWSPFLLCWWVRFSQCPFVSCKCFLILQVLKTYCVYLKAVFCFGAVVPTYCSCAFPLLWSFWTFAGLFEFASLKNFQNICHSADLCLFTSRQQGVRAITRSSWGRMFNLNRLKIIMKNFTDK